MTPKQELVAHLEAHHDGTITYLGTHKQLTQRHHADHEARRLTHHHRHASGYVDGSEQEDVRIFLSPPKNPGSNKREDRNWVLSISHPKHGWRHEMHGTSAGLPEEAKAAADKLLGYEANWVAVGWGFQHEEKAEKR